MTGIVRAPVFDVAKFGAVGDGVTDDSAAIQAAIDAAELVRGTVKLGLQHRLSTGLVINSTCVLKGWGGYHTFLLPDSGVRALSVRANSLAQRRWDVNYDRAVSEMGTRLEGFAIQGTNGQNQTGIVWYGDCDRTSTADVKCFNLDTGWLIGELDAEDSAFTREAWWYDCAVDNCGTLAGNPSIRIRQVDPVSGGSDGNNHLFFSGLRHVYNYGQFVIEDASTAETQRRIVFAYLMLHGRNTVDPGTGPTDTMAITGLVRDVQMYGLMANGSGTGGSCIRLGPDGRGLAPNGVKIDGSVGTSDGSGIVVAGAEAVDLSLLNAGAVTEDLVRVDSGALNSKPMRLNVESSSESTADTTINIAASERPFVHGYWDGKQQARDEAFASATGPILVDRTTATEYRLLVDNGALSVEAV